MRHYRDGQRVMVEFTKPLLLTETKPNSNFISYDINNNTGIIVTHNKKIPVNLQNANKKSINQLAYFGINGTPTYNQLASSLSTHPGIYLQGEYHATLLSQGCILERKTGNKTLRIYAPKNIISSQKVLVKHDEYFFD